MFQKQTKINVIFQSQLKKKWWDEKKMKIKNIRKKWKSTWMVKTKFNVIFDFSKKLLLNKKRWNKKKKKTKQREQSRRRRRRKRRNTNLFFIYLYILYYSYLLTLYSLFQVLPCSFIRKRMHHWKKLKIFILNKKYYRYLFFFKNVRVKKFNKI